MGTGMIYIFRRLTTLFEKKYILFLKRSDKIFTNTNIRSPCLNCDNIFCIQESFNTNISHNFFDYTITFVNSQH